MKFAILTVCLGLVGAAEARAELTREWYDAAYAASLKDRIPLLVFVGQPAREIPGARSIAVTTFPEATGPCLVVGVVRDAAMYRKDLGGTPSTSDIQVAVASLSNPGTPEALDEVNAIRAARGLRPFIGDSNLTLAAASCAEFRAARLIAGHTANDFAALPPGAWATSSGCAAWEPGWGWGSCCTYDGYTYAGAAYAFGRDGRRYMHLFVR
jgi:hypothetical protein